MRSDGSKRDSRGARRTPPSGHPPHWISRLFPGTLWRRVDAACSRHSSEKARSLVRIREARIDHAQERRAHLSAPDGITYFNIFLPDQLQTELDITTIRLSRDCSFGRLADVAIGQTVIGMVQNVEEFGP